MTEDVLEIRSTIEIGAPPERIWKVLMAFDSYQAWNPFVRSVVVNKLRVGSKLHIRVRRPPGGRSRHYSATVTSLTQGAELGWRRSFLLARFFSAEHTFIIVPNGLEGSTFIQRERYSGKFARFFVRRNEATITECFEAMNRAIKRAAQK